MGLKTRLIGKSLTICPWVANDLDEHAHEMDEKCVVVRINNLSMFRTKSKYVAFELL